MVSNQGAVVFLLDRCKSAVALCEGITINLNKAAEAPAQKRKVWCVSGAWWCLKLMNLLLVTQLMWGSSVLIVLLDVVPHHHLWVNVADVVSEMWFKDLKKLLCAFGIADFIRFNCCSFYQCLNASRRPKVGLRSSLPRWCSPRSEPSAPWTRASSSVS